MFYTCSLAQAAEFALTVPTPCATEARQGFQNRNRGKKGSQESLTTVIQGKPSHQAGGSLNPDWVEWLMGWPVGWTSLEPLNRENYDDWLLSVNFRTYHHTEPSIPRVATGIANRASRLKAIGNGQVPLSAWLAWTILFERVNLIGVDNVKSTTDDNVTLPIHSVS